MSLLFISHHFPSNFPRKRRWDVLGQVRQSSFLERGLDDRPDGYVFGQCAEELYRSHPPLSGESCRLQARLQAGYGKAPGPSNYTCLRIGTRLSPKPWGPPIVQIVGARCPPPAPFRLQVRKVPATLHLGVARHFDPSTVQAARGLGWKMQGSCSFGPTDPQPVFFLFGAHKPRMVLENSWLGLETLPMEYQTCQKVGLFVGMLTSRLPGLYMHFGKII